MSGPGELESLDSDGVAMAQLGELIEVLVEALANVERVTDGGATAAPDLLRWLHRARAVVAEAKGEESEAQTLNLADLWLVWSYEHDAWWAPNRCGYTSNLTSAGLYTEAQAREIEEDANRGGRRTEEARPFGPYLRDAEHGSVLAAVLAAGVATGGEG